MFKWGLPLFINIIAGNGASRINTDVDIIPPQSPIISALPSATNSAMIVIEGFTEARASVDLLMNDQVSEITQADDMGSFSLRTTLVRGQNTVQLKAKDVSNNESFSDKYSVLFDDEPIELIILSPKDGTEYFGKTNQVIDVKGEVEKDDSQVLINNSFVQIDRNGSFVHRIMLSGGDNKIVIVATDKSGNTSEKSINLVYTP